MLNSKRQTLLDLFSMQNSDKIYEQLDLIAAKAEAIRDKKESREAFSLEEAQFLAHYYSRAHIGKALIIDENNSNLFQVLSYYFTRDPLFNAHAQLMGVENPSLGKGLLIVGNPGVGKTHLMRIFSSNLRQSFQVINAKKIANTYEIDGREMIEEYETKKRSQNPFEFPFHKSIGLCIDDLGTEDLKSHMGNKCNVLADVIESRYDSQAMGVFMHATSNLTAKQLQDYYGPRVMSRFKETMNLLVLGGTDRRK